MPEIKTTITIDAPKEKIWEILLDFDRYPEWNPFMRLKGRPVVGQTIKLEAHVDGRVLKLGAKIRWGGPDNPVAGLLINAEHYVRIEAVGDDRCRIDHGETFGGLIGTLAWPMIRQSEKQYAAMNVALKARAEG